MPRPIKGLLSLPLQSEAVTWMLRFVLLKFTTTKMATRKTIIQSDLRLQTLLDIIGKILKLTVNTLMTIVVLLIFCVSRQQKGPHTIKDSSLGDFLLGNWPIKSMK